MPSGAIMLAIAGWQPQAWRVRFQALAPGRDIRLWSDDAGDPADVAYVCAWKPPHGLLATYPNVKAIFSLGAGVDFLLADPALPEVPIVRIVDPDLTMRMTEYVTLHVLMHHRRQRLYDEQQRGRRWRDHDQPPASAVHVGILGLGALGRDVADVLARIGFQVAGWSRTERIIPGIATYHGRDSLDAFLARTEIMVCLLPHTRATEGLLNLALFRKLKRDGAGGGATLINAGRGRLQVEADILAALDEGALAGASLDVFATEPLAVDSPLWTHPNVIVTPHNAAASDPNSLVANVLQQIERHERGEALQHVVDRKVGY